MKKERDTVILPVRIKKTMMAELNTAVSKSTKYPTRNSWVLNAIKSALRKR